MEPKEGLYWRYFSFEQEEREEESSDSEDPEQPVEMVEPEQPGEPEQPEEPELPRNVENADNCTPSDNGKNQLNSLVLLNVLLSTEIFTFCKCFLSQIWPILYSSDKFWRKRGLADRISVTAAEAKALPKVVGISYWYRPNYNTWSLHLFAVLLSLAGWVKQVEFLGTLSKFRKKNKISSLHFHVTVVQ